jgi:ferric-dicitrate binding protein FerR (iron transport regulator)
MDDRFQAWAKHPTSELNHYWEERLLQHPEERLVVERARQVLQHLSYEKSETIDREGILQRALAQAKATSPPTVSLHRRTGWYRVAAVLVGAMLVAAAYWYTLPTVQTHSTAYGESKRIELPDGSTVVLNANSTLRYPLNWEAAGPRQVTLTGEAFFSVVHQQDDRKFVVQANELAIEVLGTEFNVNHRRGETEVVLQTGSIRLDWSVGGEVSSQDPNNLVIAPGEKVVFSQDQKDVRRAVVNPTLYSSWTQDRWLFDKTPLAEVFAMIEDNYGFRVKAAPDIAKKVFTAEVDHADLDLLLDFLSESFDLAITKNQRTIIIEQK